MPHVPRRVAVRPLVVSALACQRAGSRPGRLNVRARVAGLGVVLLAVAACGTTVPQTTQVASAGNVSQAQGDGSAGGTSSGDPAALGVGSPGSVGAAGASGEAAAARGSAATTSGSAPAGAVSSGNASPGSATPTSATGSAAGSATTTGAGSKTTTSGKKTVAASSAKPGTTTKSGSPTGSTTTGSTSTGSTSTGSSTSPLKIGFLYIDASSSQAANSAAGAATTSTLTPKSVFDALVAYDNAHGGLGGRQVTIVPVAESDMSSNFASDAAAACATFTQDTPVPIVIDGVYGSGFGFSACLAKVGVEDVSVPQAPDTASLRASPFQVYPGTITPDRAYSAALNLLTQSGGLKAGVKIGVFMDKCTSTMAAYANTIEPTFKKLGLIPDVFSTECIQGYGGLGQASTDASSAVLQFRGNMDTQVMVISNNDPSYWVLYGAAASSQQYATGLIMTSYSQPTSAESNFTAAQRASIHGAGWVPVLDTNTPKLPGTAAESTCDMMATSQGQPPADNNDYYLITSYCQPLLLLQAGFAADGSNATAATLSKAITGLGTSFSDPGVIGGQADLSHQDAPSDAQIFTYQTSCSCLAYSGSPQPV